MKKTIIDAEKRGLQLELKELLQYKDLFWTLAYRDYRVRYAQTFLGFAWAFIQPIATLLIFTLVFSRAVGVDTGDVPYPLFAVCGMMGWVYFAFVLNQSGNSLIGAQAIVKKIYFPRLIIPLSKAIVGLIDYTISIILMVALLIYFQFVPSGQWYLLPVVVLANGVAALGVGIWVSALTVRYRDFIHILPFMVQFGLYATPVGYPSSLLMDSLPQWAQGLYYLNPMAGIVEGYRAVLLGVPIPSPLSYLSLGVAVVLLVTGLFYFKKVEYQIADLI
ncbi:MAG: ABC transporter permease [Bacteroidota bacterium]